jgi:hypothetical protein
MQLAQQGIDKNGGRLGLALELGAHIKGSQMLGIVIVVLLYAAFTLAVIVGSEWPTCIQQL